MTVLYLFFKAQQFGLKDWTQIAVAHYGGNANGGTVMVEAGPSRSSFANEAIKLDKGSIGKYWSQHRELAARAFQSYVEDKLTSLNRRSDYLSALADNKVYAIFGQKPFPEGEERQRINAAFDRFIAVMQKRKTLEKAYRLLNSRYLFFKAAS